MDALKIRLSGHSGGKLLDVATGRGSFARILMNSFKEYDEILAIDNCDTSKLYEAQNTFDSENITFICMNGENMEFENDFFDTVSISNSLHHMSRPERVLGEMQRVLKPGGVFIINEMIRDNQTEPQLTHVQMHHWWAAIDTQLGIYHKETYCKNDVLRLAGELNLSTFEIFEHVDSVTDPKDYEKIQYMYKIIDEYCEKAKGLSDYHSFKLQGDIFRKRLSNIGIANATQVIILGKK